MICVPVSPANFVIAELNEKCKRREIKATTLKTAFQFINSEIVLPAQIETREAEKQKSTPAVNDN